MERQLTIKTPSLGEDVLQLVSMHGHEELGRLFEYNLELYSEDESVDVASILGENVTVELEIHDGGIRYFNGFISNFTQTGGSASEYTVYHATMRPWLWFLSRTSDCRIFEEMKVPDIVQQIFSDNGFSDFALELSETYSVWEYCVQYRETDFQFVSRLLEQEGIYYYFKHEFGKHKLVLTDSVSGHDVIRGEAYPYNETDSDMVERVSEWQVQHKLQPGVFAAKDYDYKNPTKSRSNIPQTVALPSHAHSDHELFDYPGEFIQKGSAADGTAEVTSRLQALHVDHERVEAQTNVRDFCAGRLFKIEDHPRADQNDREYLIVGATCTVGSEQFSSGPGAAETSFSCTFTAIPSVTPFRSANLTPKPVVQGPQAAVVVDDTDPEGLGRVRVQFYWDRTDQSSCWTRVSQGSAGPGWGSMFVPHIDHEVIVNFYEGDPDRPIITGKVYNADNMPPDLWDGGISNSVITDHVENKINLDGAGVPIIHITQPKGNEILMNDEEGIQIRDHHGNEIVLDAQNGTIKIRAPDHESYVEFGNSINLGTLSNFATEIAGNVITDVTGFYKKTIGGKYEEKILDVTASTFIGAKHEQSIAVTNSSFFGLKVSTSMAVDISANNDHKIIKDKKTDRTSSVHVTEKSPEIEYAAEESKVMLSAARALLKSGNSSVLVKKNADVMVSAKSKFLVFAESGAKIDGGPTAELKASSTVTIKGSNINVG